MDFAKGSKAVRNSRRDFCASRPDGLIVLRVGRHRWKALVETKIGNARLDKEQLASYMRLARENNIDAVVTVSNQFTSRPDHHPVNLSAKTRSRVKIYHWSWMYIITQADLLISNDGIEDRTSILFSPRC